MNIENRLLTEFDIKHIISTIGREPSDIELDFIEDVIQIKLKNRDYLEILARLNNGAGREDNNKITLTNEQTIQFFNGVRVYEDKKLNFDTDSLKSEFVTNGLEPIVSSYSIVGNNIDVNQINRKLGNGKHPDSFQYIPSNNKLDEIQFSSTICLDNSENIYNIDDINDFQLYIINFGKTTKKNQLKFKSLIDLSEKNEWQAILKVAKNNNMNGVLVNMLNNINCGAIIPNILLQYYGTSKKTKMVLFVVLNKAFSPKLKSFCKDSDIEIEKYGELVSEKSIQFNEKDQNIINLPLETFDLRFDINTKHYDEPEGNISISKEIIKGVDKTSLNNQLLKLFEIINKTNNMWHSEKRILKNEYSRYGIPSKTEKLKDQLFIVQADRNNLLNITPRMSGKMSIANASRKMSCMGIKPMNIVIHNIFPNPNPKSNWITSELLQGQEEAIREIDLEIGNRQIDTFNENWYQNVLTVGYIKNNSSKADISFKNNGDFISLLGSHRGELGGSEYEKYISDNTSKSFPSVDLNMERRLQDVVQQGITTKLIKSATNVGMGGISIAIANSLFASDIGIGARIHLSRKLTDQELLFGETQGLVVVTLSEEDIMEFERICMTVGVPSTTIGRVTDNHLYTFNELISVKVDKLKKVLN